MTLFWTREAIQDRRKTRDHVATDDPAAALALDARVAEKARRLIHHPDMGRPGRVSGTRDLIVHRSYVLIYEVEGGAVRILRLLTYGANGPDVTRVMTAGIFIRKAVRLKNHWL